MSGQISPKGSALTSFEEVLYTWELNWERCECDLPGGLFSFGSITAMNQEPDMRGRLVLYGFVRLRRAGRCGAGLLTRPTEVTLHNHQMVKKRGS